MKLTLLLAMFMTTSALSAPTKSSSKASIRLDCANSVTNGSTTQSCLQVTGVKFSHDTQISDEAQLYVAIDPFGTPSKSLALQINTPNFPIPSIRDTSMGFISDFKLQWQIRPALTLALQSYGGSTNVPRVHDLAMGSRFIYAGWNQAALTATYILGKTKDTRFEIALGNGEGELTTNIDPQQYAGFSFNKKVYEYIHIYLAASIDLNTYGSEAFSSVYDTPSDDIITGFSVERMAASLHLVDFMGSTPGLKLSCTYHQTVAKDLDKKITSIPTTAYADNSNLTIRDLYVENPSEQVANKVTTDVFNIAASYQIMAIHSIALDYEVRSVNTGSVDFFQDSNQNNSNKLSQINTTIGANIRLSPELVAQLEYHKSSYNKIFSKFNYTGSGNKLSKNTDLFNLRIAYAW